MSKPIQITTYIADSLKDFSAALDTYDFNYFERGAYAPAPVGSVNFNKCDTMMDALNVSIARNNLKAEIEITVSNAVSRATEMARRLFVDATESSLKRSIQIEIARGKAALASIAEASTHREIIACMVTVNECLEEEKERLWDARNNILRHSEDLLEAWYKLLALLYPVPEHPRDTPIDESPDAALEIERARSCVELSLGKLVEEIKCFVEKNSREPTEYSSWWEVLTVAWATFVNHMFPSAPPGLTIDQVDLEKDMDTSDDLLFTTTCDPAWSLHSPPPTMLLQATSAQSDAGFSTHGADDHELTSSSPSLAIPKTSRTAMLYYSSPALDPPPKFDPHPKRIPPFKLGKPKLRTSPTALGSMLAYPALGSLLAYHGGKAFDIGVPYDMY